MRRPIVPPSTEFVYDSVVKQSHLFNTAAVFVETHELVSRSTNEVKTYVVFGASFPAQYRIDQALYMRESKPCSNQDKLVLRVRSFSDGPLVSAKFLVVWNNDGKVRLPWIKPSPQDPPDSPMLQWSFWQGTRIGGGLYHDVFDVSHFEELRFPDA